MVDKHMNPKGIKSWHIAAAAVIPTFILALTTIGIAIADLMLGIQPSDSGLVMALGSLYLVVSCILAIPAVLLKTDKGRKIGAISGIILGALALITILRWQAPSGGTYILDIYALYVGVLLILSGIYYFWKKQ